MENAAMPKLTNDFDLAFLRSPPSRFGGSRNDR
jgi:hypothetical protein